MSDQVAARDTTFDNSECKSIWLDFSNIQKDDYLTVSLIIDGKEKVINEFYIPGLNRSEGITLHGHNLTWVFNTRNAEIEKLKAENAELKFELEAKQRPLGEQVLEMSMTITKLTRQRDVMKKALVRTKEIAEDMIICDRNSCCFAYSYSDFISETNKALQEAEGMK